MIGVTTPEYQLSRSGAPSLGELVEDLDVAALTNGKIAVVYTQTNLAGRVQLFDPATGISTQLVQLSSPSPPGSGYITDVDVTALPGGGFAVLGLDGYRSPGQQPYYLWTFDAAGAMVGGPTPVLGAEAAYATLHATASGALISFGDGPHGSRAGMIQRLDATGALLGTAMAVSGGTVQQEIEIVRLGNGRMAAVSHGSTGTKVSELFANGTPTGAVATVNSYGTSSASAGLNPQIAVTSTGFVTLHNGLSGLELTRFNTSFVQLGTATTVLAAYSGGSPGGYLKPDSSDQCFDVAVLPSGVIVIAWRAYEASGSGNADILIRFLAPDGAALTDPIIANARIPDDQSGVSLTVMPDGRIFLSFLDDTNVLGGPQQSGRGVFIDGPDGYFIGGAGHDNRTGTAGDDVMLGNGGNDTLNGGEGDDQLSGGEGNDSLLGLGGNDQINGQNGDDQLFGGTGNDLLQGGAGNDILQGGTGHDVLSGEAGNDVLKGDSGNDTLYGGDNDDALDGGTGHDWLYGGAGADNLLGGGGHDRLYGGDGNDTMDGGVANDTMEGGAGDDEMFGGSGHDALYAGDGNDVLRGAGGHDILNGDAGDDTISGGLGNDIIVGGRGNDYLAGNDGSDSIVGGLGNDVLKGGSSNDTLHGGAGDDRLYGEAGKDVFQFSFFWSEGGSIGNDRIMDYQRGYDSIDMTGWGFQLGTTLTLSERAGSTVLTTSAGEVTLQGISLASFDPGDILL